MLLDTLSILEPPPELKVSDWADQHRQLSSESSSEPGQWLTERAEFQREMMDVYNDPVIEEIVIMSSSQVGKTEIINNIIGYAIDQDPCPILLIQPTLEMAMTWSKDRFTPMVRDTKVLTNKVAEAKAKDGANTILHKTFTGGHITVAGANSPASLAMRPIRVCIFDEVDRYPSSAGNEGDPVKLGVKRTQTFYNKKIILTSTPTISGVSRIEYAYENSDKRLYMVPCVHCGTFQKLEWKQLKFKHNESKVTECYYECNECSGIITEQHKYEMIRRGKWVITNPDVEKVAGFWINELYSPWSSWQQMVEEWLLAHKRTETLKVFVNTSLGETWIEEENNQIDGMEIMKRCEDYELPDDVLVLTAGIDVQNDRIEVVVKGWGLENESWYIDRKIIYGSPARSETFAQLTEYLQKSYVTDASRINMKVSISFIDSGGSYTQEVYQYCKINIVNVYACKGFSGRGKMIVGKPSKTKAGVKLFTLGVDTAKELIYDRLQNKLAGAGYMHFNKKCDADYFNQLTAEKQVITYSKGFQKREWHVIKGRRNEMLDCEVYALAAYLLLNPEMGVLKAKREKEIENIKTKAPEVKKKAEVVKRRSSFVRNW